MKRKILLAAMLALCMCSSACAPRSTNNDTSSNSKTEADKSDSQSAIDGEISQTESQKSGSEENTVSSQLSDDFVKDKTYSFEELPNVEIPKVSIQKIIFYDDSMGEFGIVTEPNEIKKIMNIWQKLKIYNEEPEPDKVRADMPRGCLYWFDFFEFADDECPAFSIGFDSFFIEVGGKRNGPYRTENDDVIWKELRYLYI